jgi:hypothetical protein
MSLHNDIMNLASEPVTACKSTAERLAYRTGHRDARHAAAELANHVDSYVEELLESLQELFDYADNEQSRFNYDGDVKEDSLMMNKARELLAKGK